jgi:hypothetical protein
MTLFMIRIDSHCIGRLSGRGRATQSSGQQADLDIYAALNVLCHLSGPVMAAKGKPRGDDSNEADKQ